MWRPEKFQPETAPDGSTVLRGAFLTLFEDDFAPARRAVVTPPPAAEVPPPAPVLTVADVEAAYADGMRAGAASAAAAAARQTEATLQVVLAELATLGADGLQANEAAANAIAGLLLTTLQRFFPVLAASFGAAEAAAVAQRVLQGLHNEPEVVIRAAPDTVRELQRLFDQHPPEGPTKISLVATDAMPVGDVALRWREGRAARDTDRLWREVTEALGLQGLTESAALNKDL